MGKIKVYRVEFGFGESIFSIVEWLTLIGMEELEANSAEDAAMFCAQTDGMQGAYFKVHELTRDEFGALVRKGELEYFYFG